jgi:hypothetical protein
MRAPLFLRSAAAASPLLGVPFLPFVLLLTFVGACRFSLRAFDNIVETLRDYSDWTVTPRWHDRLFHCILLVIVPIVIRVLFYSRFVVVGPLVGQWLAGRSICVPFESDVSDKSKS